jgi:hypothetical protein
MIVVIGGGGSATAIEVEWEIDIHHIPFTRIWVTTMLSGVPVGAQIAWLSCNNTGMPPARTRVAAVTHWAVTQGPLAPGGGGNVHPATT